MKPELGNKRRCRNCGARFFDLNKNPITCPKCGALFEATPLSRAAQRAATVDDEADPLVGAELATVEDADAGSDRIAVVDNIETEIADDTLLEEEEKDDDDDDDVVGLIDGESRRDEER